MAGKKKVDSTRPSSKKSDTKSTDKTKVAPIIAKDRGEVKVEKLPDDHGLLQSMFDFYVEEWKRGHPGDKKPREYFYVSDVGRCPRSIYYQFYNSEMKKDMAASTIMMFKFGDLFHDEVQRVLRSLGHTISKNIEFGTYSKVGFMKRGRLDVLLSFVETKGKVVIPILVVGEIKSQNPYSYENPPSESEIDQTLSYIHDCKNDPYFKDKTIADFGLLIYADRGGLATPPMCIWKVHYSEKRVAVIKNEFWRLYRAIKNKKIPDRPYEMESVPCTYCRFQMSICWKGFELPEAPALEADESIPPPTQEIVDSMAEACIRLKGEISEREKELKVAKNVVMQYFKSTGVGEILPKAGGKLKHSRAKITFIKEKYLLGKLKDKWHLFSKPQLGLLRKRVKEGRIDATTFQRGIMVDWGEASVSITLPKKEKAK